LFIYCPFFKEVTVVVPLNSKPERLCNFFAAPPFFARRFGFEDVVNCIFKDEIRLFVGFDIFRIRWLRLVLGSLSPTVFTPLVLAYFTLGDVLPSIVADFVVGALVIHTAKSRKEKELKIVIPMSLKTILRIRATSVENTGTIGIVPFLEEENNQSALSHKLGRRLAIPGTLSKSQGL